MPGASIFEISGRSKARPDAITCTISCACQGHLSRAARLWQRNIDSLTGGMLGAGLGHAVVSCATGTLSLGMRFIESVCNKADALISLTPMGTYLPAPKLGGDMIVRSLSHGYSIFNVLLVQGSSCGCLRNTRGSLSMACHGSIVLALLWSPSCVHGRPHWASCLIVIFRKDSFPSGVQEGRRWGLYPTPWSVFSLWARLLSNSKSTIPAF